LGGKLSIGDTPKARKKGHISYMTWNPARQRTIPPDRQSNAKGRGGDPALAIKGGGVGKAVIIPGPGNLRISGEKSHEEPREERVLKEVAMTTFTRFGSSLNPNNVN